MLAIRRDHVIIIGDGFSGAYRDRVEVPLPPVMDSIANGLYYLQVTARRDGAESDPVVLKLLFLK